MNTGKTKVVFRFAITDQREEMDGQRVEYNWTAMAVVSCRGKKVLLVDAPMCTLSQRRVFVKTERK